MARPKRDTETPDAKARLEDAFWELMEDPGYNEMSIAMLAKRAGINHNTIYYHYPGGIEELALHLLEQNIPPELPGFMMHGGSDAPESLYESITPDDMLRWKRFYLFLMTHSDPLSYRARDMMFDSLCQYHNLDRDRITPQQILSLRFIFRGYAVLLQSIVDRNDPAVITEFTRSPLGKAVRQTIADLPRKET